MALEDKLKILIDGEESNGFSLLEFQGGFRESMVGLIVYWPWDGKENPDKGYYEIMEVIDDNSAKVQRWL